MKIFENEELSVNQFVERGKDFFSIKTLLFYIKKTTQKNVGAFMCVTLIADSCLKLHS